METKFTKGKWVAEYSKANNAYEIGPLFPDRDDGLIDWTKEICMTADDNQANAHLIAASPDMYEALEAILMESLKVRRSDMPPHMWGAVMNAKAILSKARGESNE